MTRRFEYDIRSKTYDVVREAMGTARVEWYNILGSEGWEIFKAEGSFNKDYTNYFEYVYMRREIA